jgi:hypothetical protein
MDSYIKLTVGSPGSILFILIHLAGSLVLHRKKMLWDISSPILKLMLCSMPYASLMLAIVRRGSMIIGVVNPLGQRTL